MFDTVVTEIKTETETLSKTKTTTTTPLSIAAAAAEAEAVFITTTSQINELDSIPQTTFNCNEHSLPNVITTTTKTNKDALLNKTTTINSNYHYKCSNSVQNLRNLWNQRIIDNSSHILQQQQQQQQHDNKTSGGSLHFLNTRAQSLHDCTQIVESNVKYNVMARDRDRLQREKDNFYKYKTAEQSSRYKRYENGRPTYLLMRRSTLNTLTTTPTTTTTNMNNMNNDSQLILNAHQIDNNNADKPPIPPPRALKQTTTINSNNHENIAIENEQKTVEKEEEEEAITKNDVNKKNVKEEQEEEESLLEDDDQSKVVKEEEEEDKKEEKVLIKNQQHYLNNTKKRYSFKSYTKSYPIRANKIMMNNNNNRESMGLTNLCSSNIVANLTKQFNDIIKNDKKLLNEVKNNKNSTIFMTRTRGSHIYKVINQKETTTTTTAAANHLTNHLTNSVAIAVKRNNSNKSAPNSKQIKQLEEEDNLEKKINQVEEEKKNIEIPAVEIEEKSEVTTDLALPNTSFVHGKKKLYTAKSLAEAVNVTLVNSLTITSDKDDKDSTYEPIVPRIQDYQLDNDYESIEDTTESHTPTNSGSFEFVTLNETQIEKTTLNNNNNNCSLKTTTFYAPICRNTTDELPELPKPKRRLPKSPMPVKRINGTNLQIKQRNQQTFCEGSQAEKENIYCTINSASHCYESLKAAKAQSVADSISLASNGYEHINTYRSTCGSTLTLSSEHKTNSLYDGNSAAGSVFGVQYAGSHVLAPLKDSPGELKASNNIVCERSLSSCENISIKDCSSILAGDSYTHLNVPASDNSDDWIDMTDTDEASTYTKLNTPQFVVVRERFKGLRTHQDWSKRVRDKRLLENKAKSLMEDDSDHYYETLLPMNANKEDEVEKSNNTASVSDAPLGWEYDSFDTDTEEVQEVTTKKQQQQSTDTELDMCQMRLPDPPAATNQVYAIVRKFKNFISNKKGRSGTGGAGSKAFSSQKLYENTSQFYVNENNYENVPKTSDSTLSRITKKNDNAVYKNMNFSTLRSKSKADGNGKTANSAERQSTHSCNSTFYVDDVKINSVANTSNKSNEGASENNNDTARKSKRNSSKELTTQRQRPNEPPPAPPQESRPVSGTLWYAECGVFKNGNAPNEQARNKSTASYNGTNSSWYAEAGLYQTSGTSSLASSSGSSAVSTVNESQLGDENLHTMFLNEPLYQIYNAAKLESISRDLDTRDNCSTVDYEEIERVGTVSVSAVIEENTAVVKEKKRPSALQLVEPKNGPSRTLWSEIPEVIQSNILSTLTSRERALQEAKFEIITSEASYLKSLNLLRNHFMSHPLFNDTNVVSARDRRVLFGHIIPVHECSERLLTELEQCWQDNIMLLGLSKRIYAAAETHFHVYVTFCEHQGRMDRTLRRLKEANNSIFSQNLELLEQSAVCFGLNLHSFLMLPMQRITRLPLLIDAVFSKMQSTDEEYESWKITLAMMNKLVAQCNEAANASEQAYEIERIARQLEFPSFMRPLAIAPAGVAKPGAKPRFLVKRGELTHLIWRGDDAKLTFGKKFSKVSIYLFLFSDLLVLTKRKNENQFTVIDYCPRNMLTIAAGKELPQLPIKEIGHKNLILMTLLENHERKTIEMLLSCPSVSEQERWLAAMQPRAATLPGEALYEQWDCPQVIAKHTFVSNEPDALNLDVGDVVNVARKLPDGWYHGERIRDGATGWFPGSYTYEVNSAHVRARNLKQRYRLLTFTASFLEAQKSK